MLGALWGSSYTATAPAADPSVSNLSGHAPSNTSAGAWQWAPATRPPCAPAAAQVLAAAPPVAGDARASGRGVDAGRDAHRRRLDLEDSYHLPFATNRAAWPSAALAQLLAQQAECLGDSQLTLTLLQSDEQEQQQQGGTDPTASQLKGPDGTSSATALQRGLQDAALGMTAAAAPEVASIQQQQQQQQQQEALEAAPSVVLRLPQPHLTVGFGGTGDWLDVPNSYLPLWQQLQLRPVRGPKPVLYYAICAEGMQEQAASFLRDLGAAYSACRLGSHEPATSAPGPRGPGVAPGLPQTAIIATPWAAAGAGGAAEQGPCGAAGGPEGADGWMGGLRQACRQLQITLTLAPPVLSYHPRSLDDPPEASLVVYVLAPSDSDEQLLASFLTAAQYIGPLLPAEGGQREGAAAGGAAAAPRWDSLDPMGLEAAAAAAAGNGTHLEQCSQGHGGGGGGGALGAARQRGALPPPRWCSGLSPEQQHAAASCTPTPARPLAVAVAAPANGASPAPAAAGTGGSGGAARSGLYLSAAGSAHSAPSLAARGCGRPLDVVLQVVRRSAAEAAGEAELRSIALAVYSRARRRRRPPKGDPSLFPQARHADTALSDNASDAALCRAAAGAHRSGAQPQGSEVGAGGAASLLSPSPTTRAGRRAPAPLDGVALYAPPFVLPPPDAAFALTWGPARHAPSQQQQQQQHNLQQQPPKQYIQQQQHSQQQHDQQHCPSDNPRSQLQQQQQRTLHVCVAWRPIPAPLGHGGSGDGAGGRAIARQGFLLALTATDCQGELLCSQVVTLGGGARKALLDLAPAPAPGCGGGGDAAGARRRAADAAAVAAAGMRRCLQLTADIGASARGGVSVARLAVSLVGPLSEEHERAWASACATAAERLGLAPAASPGGAGGGGCRGGGGGFGQQQEGGEAAGGWADDADYATGLLGDADAGAHRLLSQPSIGCTDGDWLDAALAGAAAAKEAGLTAAAAAAAPERRTAFAPAPPGRGWPQLLELAVCRVDPVGPVALDGRCGAALRGQAAADGADGSAAGGPGPCSVVLLRPGLLCGGGDAPGGVSGAAAEAAGGASGGGPSGSAPSAAAAFIGRVTLEGAPRAGAAAAAAAAAGGPWVSASAINVAVLGAAARPRPSAAGAGACADTAAEQQQQQQQQQRGDGNSALPDPARKRPRLLSPGGTGSGAAAEDAEAAAVWVSHDLARLSLLASCWHAAAGAPCQGGAPRSRAPLPAARGAAGAWAADASARGGLYLLPLHCAVALRALGLAAAATSSCV